MIRKQYPIELKLKIVQECLETGNCAVVARRYNIASNIVNRWTRNYRKYGEAAFKAAAQQSQQMNPFILGNTKKSYPKMRN